MRRSSSAPKLFQIRSMLLVFGLLGTVMPVPGVTAERVGRYDAPRISLHLARRMTEPSPFRLAIDRSEYKVNGGESAVAVAGKGRGGLMAMIDRQAQSRGLDPALVHAVVRAESAYRPDAVSAKGAIGLMQVMPATGRRFGVADLTEPNSNVKAGTIYLRHLLDRFDNVPLALAAYNAGEGAVMRFGNKVPPFPETQDYVQGILRDYGKTLAQDAPLPHVYTDGIRLAEDSLAPYRLTSGSLGN